MEANGLSKSYPHTSCLGWGDVFRYHDGIASKAIVEDAMTDASTRDRAGGGSVVILNTSLAAAAPMATTITPTNSSDGMEELPASIILKGVSDNVKFAQAGIWDIEERIGNHQMQEEDGTKRPQHRQSSMELLENQLFAAKIRRIDALVVMGWEHYRWFLAESNSHETAAAAVRHIYEEALDASIELFCSSTPASVDATINNERLMILLLVLDFDEYCETLLEYELAREYLAAQPAGGKDNIQERQTMERAINPAQQGPTFLRQLHDLWRTGAFDRFGDPSGREHEDDLARVHAAGLCLVLFRRLESRVPPRPDLDAMEQQFRYLFDEYLPGQLAQPSMNNIVATKYARVLFDRSNGKPTVYWSLLADSYGREWGDFDNNDAVDDDTSSCSTDDDSVDMDTDDDDDGL